MDRLESAVEHSERWLEDLSRFGSVQKQLPAYLASLAQAITRLADDQVEFDRVEARLLSLSLAGIISIRQAIGFQSQYLREQAVTAEKASFDPFGDLDSLGYLRITTGDYAPSIIKRIEHLAFSANIERTMSLLRTEKALSYTSLLKTHQLLFGDIYPWAGQDRFATSPTLAICKVSGKFKIEFARPVDIRRSVDYALRLASNSLTLIDNVGEVLAHLAYAHPFLDGNGRAILLLHIEICRRAGLCVDWHCADTQQFLNTLAVDIENPAHKATQAFLAPLTHPLV